MAGQFCISLDFELMWGVHDSRSISSYGAHILGVREAVPAMLDCFVRYGLRASWATVGLMACRDKKQLLALVPPETLRPCYAKAGLSSYDYLDQVGEDEADDPYHFGASLIERVVQTEGQEIGSHSFSHYYCAEQGASKASFIADIEASKAVFDGYGIALKSYVFARNQWNNEYAALLAQHGYVAARGNPAHSAYDMASGEANSKANKLFRLADSYVAFSGAQTHAVMMHESGLKNVCASRFFYPYNPSRKALEGIKLRRIKAAMSYAAKKGELFHLWWHPHNFGQHLAENMQMLEAVGKHFRSLQERYDMRAVTMAQAACVV